MDEAVWKTSDTAESLSPLECLSLILRKHHIDMMGAKIA